MNGLTSEWPNKRAAKQVNGQARERPSGGGGQGRQMEEKVESGGREWREGWSRVEEVGMEWK